MITADYVRDCDCEYVSIIVHQIRSIESELIQLRPTKSQPICVIIKITVKSQFTYRLPN